LPEGFGAFDAMTSSIRRTMTAASRAEATPHETIEILLEHDGRGNGTLDQPRKAIGFVLSTIWGCVNLLPSG